MHSQGYPHRESNWAGVIHSFFGQYRYKGSSMKTQHRQSGVTLSELMIALSVIAILLTLSAPSFSGFISKRQVTGTTNLIASYFDNVKMEAARRNSFITITYNKSTDGTQWCFGAKAGEHQTCDCLAEGDAMDCKLPVGGTTEPMILSNTSDPGFTDLQITAAMDDNDHFDVNPVRGTLSHSSSVVIQVRDESEAYRVNVAVTPTGRVSKCTPSDYRLVGFPECI